MQTFHLCLSLPTINICAASFNQAPLTHYTTIYILLLVHLCVCIAHICGVNVVIILVTIFFFSTEKTRNAVINVARKCINSHRG